jgi:GTP-binding protein
VIDVAELVLFAGDGGDGSVHFRREKYVPRGGPDGGDGGRGGSVFLTATRGMTTLLPLRYTKEIKARRGRDGGGQKRNGRAGEDRWITVPVGTRVFTRRGTVTEEVDLEEDGQTWCGAWGGEGGRGNVNFATASNRTPLVAEAGGHGEIANVRVELLLLADAALIGQPNAGKSSLLTMISRAHPKIAEYPFTTTEPVLGVVEDEGAEFVAVEIPGLLEGAHEGKGLGDEFLRHAQRTRLSVHVVDVSSDNALAAYKQVQEEIKAFSDEMSERPVIVVANKIDISGAEENAKRLRAQLSGKVEGVFSVSAATGKGIKPLLRKITEVLSREKGSINIQPNDVQPRGNQNRLPQEGLMEIVQPSPGVFIVESLRAERIVRGTPLGPWHARLQLWEQLRQIGVARALELAGAGPGDKVCFGNFELEWI